MSEIDQTLPPPDPDAEGLIEVPTEDQPSQDPRDALDDIEMAELQEKEGD